MKELADFLRKLRGRESLRSVARRSGVSYGYIRILELNTENKIESRPAPEILEKLSVAYNVPYDELMRLAGYSKTEEEQYKLATQQLFDVIQKMKQIDVQDIKNIKVNVGEKELDEFQKQILIDLAIAMVRRNQNTPSDTE